jgi:hypothetical protein
MKFLITENKVAIDYCPCFREYSIDIRGDSIACQRMFYCPWCGKILPKSLRLEFAAELEQLGYDGIFDENIPDKYKTDEWWREKETKQ